MSIFKEQENHIAEDNSIPVEYEELVPVEALFQKFDELNRKYQLFNKGDAVLDLGCGQGRITNYISETGCFVEGVDIDKENIQVSKEKYPLIDFIIADAVDFKTSKKYDVIVSQMVVCNIESETSVKKFFANAYGLLKNGGRFFLSNADTNTQFEDGDWVKHSFENSLAVGNKMGVQLLKKSGEYSEVWDNYAYPEEKLVEWLKLIGFTEIVVDNSMRNQGYYFIISKKHE